MSQKKLIFFAVIAVLVLGIGITLSVLSSQKKDTGPKGPKELNVWVVEDDAGGYKDIVEAFKSQNDRYKDTDVKVTKFASYADYEKTLLNVMADGNSPDVFMLSSDGAGVLENKIEPLPSSVISADEFSKTFDRLFDPLVTERVTQNEEGKEITVSEIRGIPMGYETMGAFYNLELVSGSVPASWKELEERVADVSASDGGEGGYASSPERVLVGAGLPGKYVPGASDLLALFLVQHGVESSERLNDGDAVKAATQYFAYGASAAETPSGVESNGNSLIALKGEMDRLGITAVDLFVRGKVGIVFGYPSLLREIQYAFKRTQDAELPKRALRATAVPSVDPKKPVNLARYRYFAVSKYSAYPEAGFDFLRHLAQKSSQESYLTKFPYYLPARNELLDFRKDQVIDKDFPRVKYESFLPVQDGKLAAFNRGFPTEWEAVAENSDGTLKPARAVLSDLDDAVKCLRRHLIEGANYEESCKK